MRRARNAQGAQEAVFAALAMTTGDLVSPAIRIPNPESRIPSLSVEAAGIKFAHPVLAAPGPLGFGREVQSVVDLSGFAAFVTKSVTLDPRPGYPYPQVVPTVGGWLNSQGLPNHGLAGFVTKDLPFLRTLRIPLIVSIAGETVREFVTLAEWLSREEGVAAVGLQLACPHGGRGPLLCVAPPLAPGGVAPVRAGVTAPPLVKL